MKKAVFIDRDGVINKMVSIAGKYDSPKKAAHVVLVEGVVEVISWLNNKKIPVIEITNQPDFALGNYDWQTLGDIESRVHDLLNRAGVYIDKIYQCFHHPNSIHPDLNINCDCRKPKSGLLIQAARELNLDLKHSVILGDNATDMEAGKNVGCKTILFFHTYDIKEKVNVNKKYKADFKVYSHQGVIPILRKLFK